MNKYEQLIDFIINEDEAKARELFHQIVVEKSREIYESLIDEQDLEEVGGNAVEELVDEVSADETGMEEGEDMEVDMPVADDEAEEEADDEAEEDGEEEEAEEEAEEELEDRVMDLESALDDLKAEFDALMADEASEPEHNDGMNDPEMDVEEMPAMAFEAEEKVEEDEEEVDESADEELARLREYVEKVSGVKKEEGADNKSSVVAGKNDMGGTAANIAKGGEENGRPAPKAKEIASGNRNVPGGKADKLETAPKAKSAE